MEQRLFDYISIKKYNRLHKITPKVSPEKLFNITQDDITIIQSYYNKQPTIQYKQVLHHLDKKFLDKAHKPNFNNLLDTIYNFEEYPAYMIGEIISKKNKNFSVISNKFNKNMSPIERDMLLRGQGSYSEYASNIPNHPKKSYGYDNPHEIYYDYIDNNMQLPEHVDMYFPRGGESTRLENRINKKYDRDIMQ